MEDKKEKRNEISQKSKKIFTEFKAFIAKGNVIDLAVGVIIGTAFSKIVTSVVNDILMPLIGVLIGGVDFTQLSFKIGDSTIAYGNFIQNLIDFLIIAVCIFAFVKIIQRITKKEKQEEVVEVKKDEQILLLEEIRDLLKKETVEK